MFSEDIMSNFREAIRIALYKYNSSKNLNWIIWNVY